MTAMAKQAAVLLLALTSPAFAKDAKPKAPVDSATTLDPLVLAAHLTRPEVIDGCLKEVKGSKYDFIWTSIETKESRDPVNVTIKLHAALVDTASGKPSETRATLTVARDVEKLRKGQLYFNCQIDYQPPLK